LLLFIYSVLVEHFQLDFGSQSLVLIRHQCMLAVGRLVDSRRRLNKKCQLMISLHMPDCLWRLWLLSYDCNDCNYNKYCFLDFHL
jgi:hypothetical protein